MICECGGEIVEVEGSGILLMGRRLARCVRCSENYTITASIGFQ